MSHKHVLLRHSKVYMVWTAMKQRCYNSNNKNFSQYGGRGIKVCEKWKHNFFAFLNDMGKRPDGYCLERINNDNGYSPTNCRWATRYEQARNRRPNVFIEANGLNMISKDWSDFLGMNYYTFHNKVRHRPSNEQTKIVKNLIRSKNNVISK